MEKKAIPYKIVDKAGHHKFGIVAKSFNELKEKASKKYEITPSEMKVMLEDGTEIDDQDYFETLEPNTCLVIMKDSEEWMLPFQLANATGEGDVTDGNHTTLMKLLSRLHYDYGHFIWMSEKDLELMAEMEPETMGDIVYDRSFLDNVKEACTRYLNDRRDAKDAIQLLKMYTSTLVKQKMNSKASTGNPKI